MIPEKWDQNMPPDSLVAMTGKKQQSLGFSVQYPFANISGHVKQVGKLSVKIFGSLKTQCPQCPEHHRMAFIE